MGLSFLERAKKAPFPVVPGRLYHGTVRRNESGTSPRFRISIREEGFDFRGICRGFRSLLIVHVHCQQTASVVVRNAAKLGELIVVVWLSLLPARGQNGHGGTLSGSLTLYLCPRCVLMTV